MVVTQRGWLGMVFLRLSPTFAGGESETEFFGSSISGVPKWISGFPVLFSDFSTCFHSLSTQSYFRTKYFNFYHFSMSSREHHIPYSFWNHPMPTLAYVYISIVRRRITRTFFM